MVVANVSTQTQAGGQTPVIRTVPIAALGMSLSLFFAISFVLCIVGYLIMPGLPVKHEALAIFLPGFELLTWQGFVIGLAESYAWGWYIALILGSLYNFFATRRA
jgi:hypothetical protein